MLSHSLLLLLPSLTAFAVAASQGNGLTVSTQQGSVTGTFVEPSVRQFLGIPYASANRWEAPRLPPVRKTKFDAFAFGDSCVQDLNPSSIEFLVLDGVQDIFTTESENCLTVNIWSPSTDRKQNTAVLLWIYGGSFAFGTSNITIYDGTNFVRDNDDITIVTFNYRLNIFGQPNAPQLVNNKTSQNFGLLDLDAAVQWVHDNIVNFGGDPNRISIFGQSAGSAATDAYAFAHPQDTIVKGIIQESGSISGSPSAVPVSTVLDPTPWNTVANAVGCGSSTNAAQLACMRNVPFRTLENAVISTNSSFGLVVDDISIFSNTVERAIAGEFLRVPLLAGSTANEEDIFIVLDELVTDNVVLPSITEILSDVSTLIEFTCPAGATTLHRVNNGVPTFRYQYQGVFPDISTRPDLRAFHASEIALVFGTYNVTPIPATPAEIVLSKFMQSSWVAFARDPASGLLDLGWPRYNPNTTSLVQLGNPANQSGTLLTSAALVDFACAQPDVLASIAAQVTSLFN